MIESVYKIAYLKAERSGIHLDDAEKSKTLPALEKLKAEAGINVPNTLLGMHAFLVSEGANIGYLDLLKAVKDDFFKHDHKSMFLSLVAAEWPGEMNMFVVRRIAVKKKKAEEVIERISQQYDGNVLMLKPIPPLARFFKSRHMRGNKWRRGGRPYYAMIVFDANPHQAWAMLERAADAVGELHKTGLTHMDVSLANIIADADMQHLVFVDFEYSPSPALNVAEQKLYDHLRLVESTWKFIPADERGNWQGWFNTFEKHVDADMRKVNIEKLAPALGRLLKADGLGEALRGLFKPHA